MGRKYGCYYLESEATLQLFSRNPNPYSTPAFCYHKLIIQNLVSNMLYSRTTQFRILHCSMVSALTTELYRQIAKKGSFRGYEET